MLTVKPVPAISWDNMIPPVKDYDYYKHCRDLPFEWQKIEFSMTNAWWLSETAMLAYGSESFSRPRFENAGFNQVHFFNQVGTQAYLLAADDFAVLAFRGTESNFQEGIDAFTQFAADLRTDLDVRWIDHQDGGRIHKGFFDALDDVWPDILPRIKELGSRPLWITGHSLGAALGTLAGRRLKNDRFDTIRAVYTFGSPRVGDEKFARLYNLPIFRFINHNDIVTKVPPWPYKHIGESVHINGKGLIGANGEPQQPFLHLLKKKLEEMIDATTDLKSFTAAAMPDDLKDHAPLLYVIHIWNNLVQTRGPIS